MVQVQYSRIIVKFPGYNVGPVINNFAPNLGVIYFAKMRQTVIFLPSLLCSGGQSKPCCPTLAEDAGIVSRPVAASGGLSWPAVRLYGCSAVGQVDGAVSGSETLRSGREGDNVRRDPGPAEGRTIKSEIYEE